MCSHRILLLDFVLFCFIYCSECMCVCFCPIIWLYIRWNIWNKSLNFIIPQQLKQSIHQSLHKFFYFKLKAFFFLIINVNNNMLIVVLYDSIKKTHILCQFCNLRVWKLKKSTNLCSTFRRRLSTKADIPPHL